MTPTVKNDAIKKEIAKFERGERGLISIRSIRSGKISAEFTRIIRPAQDENDARETATGTAKGESESTYHVFATDIPPGTVASDPDRFVETYRRRRGMETAYRCYEQVRPSTASRHESVRLLPLFFPRLLYNARILALHLLERITGAVWGMTLKMFSKYLDVLSPAVGQAAGPTGRRISLASSTGSRAARCAPSILPADRVRSNDHHPDSGPPRRALPTSRATYARITTISAERTPFGRSPCGSPPKNAAPAAVVAYFCRIQDGVSGTNFRQLRIQNLIYTGNCVSE